jgi:hypothetical protein
MGNILMAALAPELMRKAKRKYVRLTPATWAEIEALWQAGEVTLAELSEKYGSSPRALQNHFQKVGVAKGEKAAAMAGAVRAKLLASELGEEGDLLMRAKDVRERAYHNAGVIEDLIMGQLALAERDPTQILRVGSALKALSLAASSIERLHDVKHRALGLDKADVFPNELPEIVIRDLTPGELATLSEADDTDNDLDEGEEVSAAMVSGAPRIATAITHRGLLRPAWRKSDATSAG